MTLIKVDILEKKKEICVNCRLRVKTDLKLLLNYLHYLIIINMAWRHCTFLHKIFMLNGR